MMLFIWPMASAMWWLAFISGRNISTRPEDPDNIKVR